jgi:AcrR family transcriptional regulator
MQTQDEKAMRTMPARAGRPRDTMISAALLDAAERRMEAGGFETLTVDGLVADAGTTRQTFYRRYASIAELALEVLITRFGGQEEVDTGSLEHDLLTLQRLDVTMLSSALGRNSLAGIFEEIRTDPVVRTAYLERVIAPRRENVHAVLDRAVARGEIGSTTEADAEYICDLLIGPLLARTLLPVALPLDEEFVHRTVGTVLRELGVKATGDSGVHDD